MTKVLEFVKTNKLKLSLAASLTFNMLGSTGAIPPFLTAYAKALLAIVLGVQ